MRTILFVDDHPIFREGLRRTLEGEIVGLMVHCACDAKTTLAKLESGVDIDFLLTDYKLPDQDGLALIEAVRRLYPTVAAGLLCADLPFALLSRARMLGIAFCMSKGRSTGDLVAALQVVFEGGQYFEDVPPQGGPISPRRYEILALASKGHSDKVISDQLRISENTVRNHWKYIFTQLGVGSRTEAVGKAIRQGMI